MEKLKSIPRYLRLKSLNIGRARRTYAPGQVEMCDLFSLHLFTCIYSSQPQPL